METQEDNLTKAERNFYSQRRTHDLQIELSELLFLTFQNAIRVIELTAAHCPERLYKAFMSSFAPYKAAENVVFILEDGRRAIIRGLDHNWLYKQERDLFFALSPETQEKLRSWAISYEPETHPQDPVTP